MLSENRTSWTNSPDLGAQQSLQRTFRRVMSFNRMRPLPPVSFAREAGRRHKRDVPHAASVVDSPPSLPMKTRKQNVDPRPCMQATTAAVSKLNLGSCLDGYYIQRLPAVAHPGSARFQREFDAPCLLLACSHCCFRPLRCRPARTSDPRPLLVSHACAYCARSRCFCHPAAGLHR